MAESPVETWRPSFLHTLSFAMKQVSRQSQKVNCNPLEIYEERIFVSSAFKSLQQYIFAYHISFQSPSNLPPHLPSHLPPLDP